MNSGVAQRYSSWVAMRQMARYLANGGKTPRRLMIGSDTGASDGARFFQPRCIGIGLICARSGALALTRSADSMAMS